MASDVKTASARRGAFLACGAAIGVAIACGGSAIAERPGGSSGATSSTAGAPSSGGAPVSGGASAIAGAPSQGGATSIAGASPAAGAGGSAGAACTAPRESGQCDAYIPSFWHDPTTGLCEPFVYGGCGGNANRYPSRDACLAACPKIDGDWSECGSDSDCTMTNPGCCFPCDPVDAGSLIAINAQREAQYNDANCSNAGVCAPCLPVPENERTRKYLKPVCKNSRCTLLDIRESPLTECRQTSDCVLRDGAGCCSECDGVGWVPLNKNAELCAGSPPIPCQGCVSLPPENWDTVCLAGRCRLEGPL